jgi:hypothetical protein
MADNESTMTNAARSVGRAAGKVAKAAGKGAEPPAKPEAAPVPEDLYKASYIGSGTFIIKKPKRRSGKVHQSRVKSPQRGARK